MGKAARSGQDRSLRAGAVTSADVKLRAGHARPLRGMCTGDCRAACPQAAAGVWVWVCFRAIPVGGGVLDAPRRGQDPSLRCKPVTGGDAGLQAGHARPLRGGGWLAGAGREVRAAYMPLPTGRRIVISVFRTNIILHPKRCCPRLFLFLWCRVIIYYV